MNQKRKHRWVMLAGLAGAIFPCPGWGVNAAFDTEKKVPACVPFAPVCDSATLLAGRGALDTPEPNQPNTLDGQADGIGGLFHVDESLDRIVVSTADGSGQFRKGGLVRVDATVWAYAEYAPAVLDLYYFPDANPANSTLIRSFPATRAGTQTFTATFPLTGNASTQAVRGLFRYGTFSTGTPLHELYTDRDDLVFAVDVVPPAVALTAPAGGQTVSGLVNVAATASDNQGVSRVVFFVDGVAVATDTIAPYSYAWDTAGLWNKPYALTVRAYDDAGNTTLSAPVNVTLANPVPAIAVAPLSVAFSVPLGGANPAARTLDISNSVAGSTLAWALTESVPWLTVSPLTGTGNAQRTATLTANIAGLGVGTHTGFLSIAATNVNADVTAPVSITVTLVISATPDTTPPTLAFTSPAEGAQVIGTTLLTLDASDDRDLDRIVFFVDGIAVSTDAVQPFGHTWDTRALAPGGHEVSAIAYDQAGNSARATLNVLVAPQDRPTAFPNPYRGEPTGIQFTGLTLGSGLSIFTLNGRRLAELSADGSGRANWPATENGAPVSAGIYLASVDGPAGRRIIKVVVLR